MLPVGVETIRPSAIACVRCLPETEMEMCARCGVEPRWSTISFREWVTVGVGLERGVSGGWESRGMGDPAEEYKATFRRLRRKTRAGRVALG